MEMRITEVAEVSDLHSETGQCVGHDRAVAAEFGDLVDEFDVGALAGSLSNPFGQASNGGDTLIMPGVHPLIHNIQNFVNESVQADKGGQMTNAVNGSRQLLRAQFAKLKGGRHGNLIRLRNVEGQNLLQSSLTPGTAQIARMPKRARKRTGS